MSIKISGKMILLRGLLPLSHTGCCLGQWSFLVSCSKPVIQAQVKKYSLDFFSDSISNIVIIMLKISYIPKHVKDVNLDEIVGCACNSKCLNF